MPEKTFQRTTGRRFINRIMRGMIRLGIAPQGYYLLTVRGRKSGKLYSTPVSLIEEGGQRWLVSPYGQVSWVHNVRAAGEVALSRKGQSETMPVVELDPEESAPVLKQFIAKEAITQPYFDVKPDSPLEAFVEEAPRHPVFLIQDAT